MPPSSQNNSGAVGAPAPGAPAALSVLLLVAPGARREQLLELIGRLAPTGRVETADGALDVMRRLARASADLLVLDYAMDGVAGQSLIRHLARAAPSLSVLVFDDVVRSLAEPRCDVWPWTDAEMALQRAIERRLQRGAQRP